MIGKPSEAVDFFAKNVIVRLSTLDYTRLSLAKKVVPLCECYNRCCACKRFAFRLHKILIALLAFLKNAFPHTTTVVFWWCQRGAMIFFWNAFQCIVSHCELTDIGMGSYPVIPSILVWICRCKQCYLWWRICSFWGELGTWIYKWRGFVIKFLAVPLWVGPCDYLKCPWIA